MLFFRRGRVAGVQDHEDNRSEHDRAGDPERAGFRAGATRRSHHDPGKRQAAAERGSRQAIQTHARPDAQGKRPCTPQRSMVEYARSERRQALDDQVARDRMIRFAAVLAGAAVLFIMEQELGAKFYVALPAGVVAYIITLVVLGLMFSRSRAK